MGERRKREDLDFLRAAVMTEGRSVSAAIRDLRAVRVGLKGYSTSKLRAVCTEAGINRRGHEVVRDAELDRIVNGAIGELGDTWGRRLMTGYLRAQGIVVHEDRVGWSLARNDPRANEVRRTGAEKKLNPVSYHVAHAGQVLHADQNERLGMFGVTLVSCIDGKTGYLPAAIAMGKKNNVVIYEHLFRPIVERYGLWKTLMVDGGKEFNLICYAQHYLRLRAMGFAVGTPYRIVKSTVNNRIEGNWPHVNLKVSAHVRCALFQAENEFNMRKENEVHAFSFSQTALPVVRVGLKRYVDAWNNHRVNKRGVPVQFLQNRVNYQLQPHEIPTTAQMVRLYETPRQDGYTPHLTREDAFGRDLLRGYPQLQAQRDREVQDVVQRYIGDSEALFSRTVNRDYEPLKFTLKLHLMTTMALAGV